MPYAVWNVLQQIHYLYNQFQYKNYNYDWLLSDIFWMNRALMREKKRKFLNKYLGLVKACCQQIFPLTAAGALIGTWNRWLTCSRECFILWRRLWLGIIARCGVGENGARKLTTYFLLQRKLFLINFYEVASHFPPWVIFFKCTNGLLCK